MTASVIIPSYNGAKKLDVTLRALCEQTVSDFETIIVVDGSTDNTLSILDTFKSRMPWLKVIVQANKGRSGARNKGAEVATGDTLIFIDDDIEVFVNNVAQHIEFGKNNPSAILVGNPLLNPDQIIDNSFLQFRHRTEVGWYEKFGEELSKVSFENFFFTTQNMSIARKTFLEMGGFDERLSDSEDFDLGIRLLEQQYQIFFDPLLKVFHNDFANIDQTISRQLQYYFAKKKLLSLHPEYKNLLPHYFNWTKPTIKDLIKTIVFQNKKFWTLILSSKLFISLPEHIKSEIYSAYIYSNSVVKVKKELKL